MFKLWRSFGFRLTITFLTKSTSNQKNFLFFLYTALFDTFFTYLVVAGGVRILKNLNRAFVIGFIFQKRKICTMFDIFSKF